MIYSQVDFDLAAITTDHTEQIRLATHNDKCVVEALAENPSLCEAAQMTMLGNRPTWKHIFILASNEAIVESTQKFIAEGGSTRDRVWLACNPSLVESVQKILAKDSNTDVVVSLARNRSLTRAVQMILMHHKADVVRETLALNKFACLEVRRVFATDYISVREALASNRNIPNEIKAILANDESWVVSKTVRLHYRVIVTIKKLPRKYIPTKKAILIIGL